MIQCKYDLSTRLCFKRVSAVFKFCFDRLVCQSKREAAGSYPGSTEFYPKQIILAFHIIGLTESYLVVSLELLVNRSHQSDHPIFHRSICVL